MRVAFALDCHDREVISWIATTTGISGEMIRDMMVRCVEQRFGTLRAPQPVQWLSDNGSIFAAHRTIEIALALNLAPCFTPVRVPVDRDHRFRSNVITHSGRTRSSIPVIVIRPR